MWFLCFDDTAISICLVTWVYQGQKAYNHTAKSVLQATVLAMHIEKHIQILRDLQFYVSSLSYSHA